MIELLRNLKDYSIAAVVLIIYGMVVVSIIIGTYAGIGVIIVYAKGIGTAKRINRYLSGKQS